MLVTVVVQRVVVAVVPTQNRHGKTGASPTYTRVLHDGVHSVLFVCRR
jgi:hypothetical protein